MADIGLRMLPPRELYRANGFPEDYKIERDYTGKIYGKPSIKQIAISFRPSNGIRSFHLEQINRAISLYPHLSSTAQIKMKLNFLHKAPQPSG